MEILEQKYVFLHVKCSGTTPFVMLKMRKWKINTAINFTQFLKLKLIKVINISLLQLDSVYNS